MSPPLKLKDLVQLTRLPELGVLADPSSAALDLRKAATAAARPLAVRGKTES